MSELIDTDETTKQNASLEERIKNANMQLVASGYHKEKDQQGTELWIDRSGDVRKVSPDGEIVPVTDNPYRTANEYRSPRSNLLADIDDGDLKQMYHITRQEVEAIKNSTIVPSNTTDSELIVFLKACVRLGMDPFTRQIYLIDIRGKKTVVVGIDGYRSMAMETGEFDRSDVHFDEKDGKIISATAQVWRKGSSGPMSRTVYWSEFDKGTDPWKKMPHVMIGKVAEAHALRAAFPKVLSGTYVPEEMGVDNPHSYE